MDVAIADLNRDGLPDIVVADAGLNEVSVHLGSGAGAFGPAIESDAGDTPVWIAAGDVDGDGYEDLVVVDSGSNSVSVLHGSGDGRVQLTNHFETGDIPTQDQFVDVIDSKLRKGYVAVIDQGSDSVSVLHSLYASVPTFTVDRTPPDVTISLSHDTGASSSDGVTSDAALSGTGDPDAVVTLTENGAVVGTTVADAKGHWSTSTGLSDGTHAITASEIDATGNIGSSTTIFTLETSSPTVAMVLSNDSGSSSSDRITHDSSVTVSTDPFTSLTLLEDGQIVAVAVADENGQGHFTVQAAEGQHTFTVHATDAAGNTGSDSLDFTVDTSPPDLTLELAHDTGKSSSDGLTNDQTLRWATDPYVETTFMEGGAVLATAQADAQGRGSISLGLSDGAHTIVVQTTDAAGNVGSDQLSFTLDTQAPSPPSSLFLGKPAADFTYSFQNGFHDSDLTWSTTNEGNLIGPGGTFYFGTVPGFSPTSTVAYFSSDSRIPYQPEVISTTSGQELSSLTLALASGYGADGPAYWEMYRDGVQIQSGSMDLAFGQTVSFTDSEGFDTLKIGTSYATFSSFDGPFQNGNALFVGDTSGTFMAMPALIDGYVNAAHDTASLPLTGTAPQGVVIVIDDGIQLLGTTVAGADGTWSFALGKLGDGQHSLSATATDSAGNSSVASPPLDFTVDTSPPDVTMALAHDTGSSSSDHITSDSRLIGTTDPLTSLTFLDDGVTIGVAVADASGRWSFTPHRADGQQTITIHGADFAGNVGTETFTWTVDTTPPTVTLALADDTGSSSSDGITNDQTLRWSTDPYVETTFMEGGAVLATAQADAQGRGSISLGLSDGAHTIQVQTTDDAGNTGSDSLSFTVDSSPPTLSLDPFQVVEAGNAAGKILISGGYDGHGDGGDGNEIEVSVTDSSDVIVGQYAATVSHGRFEADMPAADAQALADGTYTLHATGSDAAGNAAAEATQSFTVSSISGVKPIFTPTSPGTYLLHSPDGTIVVATSSTLDSSDQLLGGGHDVLALHGPGSFDLTSLTQFSGFDEVNLVNPSGGQIVVLPNGQTLTVDGSASPSAAIYLGGGETVTSGGFEDRFVFQLGSGNNSIVGFTPTSAAPGTHDVLEFHGIFADPQAAYDAAQDVGSNVVVTESPTDTVTLLGIHKADLTLSDFHTV